MLKSSITQYKGILFDLDGVLCNSEPLRYKSYQVLFESEFGKKIPDRLMKERVGISVEANFDFYLNYTNVRYSDVYYLIRKRDQILIDIIKKEVIRDDELVDLIINLKESGKSLGLVSNSGRNYIKLVLDQLGILDKFDAIISGQQLKIYKPNPEIYRLALKEINLKPGDVFIVEDTNSGIRAATDAGILCYGIKREYVERLNLETKLIYNSILELFIK